MFPLKLTTLGGASVRETQEVTRIEPKKLSPAIFDAPKGYRKQVIDMEKIRQMDQESPRDTSGN